MPRFPAALSTSSVTLSSSHEHSTSGIPNYLNVVRLLLLQNIWLPNPLEDPLFRHQKTLLVRGIKGINAERETQKLPTTPDILHKMQCHLHLDSSFDATLWAACLVAFFPSSVISQSYCHLPPHQAPPAKMRCSIVPWDIILVVRWYIKTIQYRDRTLPASSKIVHCSLCPWSAVACAFKLGVFIKILNLLQNPLLFT